MNKPITLIREDLITELTNLINMSGLPAFVIEPILRDLHTEIKMVMQRQLEMEKQAYERALAEEIKTEEIKTEE